MYIENLGVTRTTRLNQAKFFVGRCKIEVKECMTGATRDANERENKSTYAESRLLRSNLGLLRTRV